MDGTGAILFDDMTCDGSETSLYAPSCLIYSNPEYYHHSSDVGVWCDRLDSSGEDCSRWYWWILTTSPENLNVSTHNLVRTLSSTVLMPSHTELYYKNRKVKNILFQLNVVHKVATSLVPSPPPSFLSLAVWYCKWREARREPGNEANSISCYYELVTDVAYNSFQDILVWFTHTRSTLMRSTPTWSTLTRSTFYKIIYLSYEINFN